MNVGALGRRLGFVIALSVFGLLVLGSAGTARAGAPDKSENDKQARTLYEQAEKSFDLGKFPEALADYQAAYEAKPLPGFLFNIAQCYRNMANYEQARFFFRRYLAVDPHAPNHRRVEELIAEMSKQLDAQAAAAAATTPPAVEAKPGDTTGGDATKPAPEVLPPSSLLPGAAPSDEGTASTPLVVATAPPPQMRRPVWKRWWFWTGVGAVVAGGAVAAFFLTRPQTVTPGSLDPIDGR